MRIEWGKKEKVILRELKKKRLSSTHRLDHITNVAKYGLLLVKKYGGDREVIAAAALLHDLGRSNPKLHGKKSSAESARQALPILKKAGYHEKEIKIILQCIKEHDRPSFSSQLLESRILKDADFLDGFGMRGVMRAAYYTAEAGEPLDKALERIEVKMQQRYKGLEFPKSRQLAQEEYQLAQLCLCSQKDNHVVVKLRHGYKGKLIVFEGISGTGKETQAKLLGKFLTKQGEKVEIIYHPTLRLKQTLKEWRADDIDGLTEAFLFLADRRDSVMKTVLPALGKGMIVISLRNWLSTLVYQTKTDWEIVLINYLYSTFEPTPDILFYLDLEPKAALKRVKKRVKETGEKKGKFEELKLLEVKRERYLELLKRVENVIKIKVDKSIEAIHTEIVQNLTWRSDEDD